MRLKHTKRNEKMSSTLGTGTTGEFIEQEFSSLSLNDKRLNQRAKTILHTLQTKLGDCKEIT